MVSAVTADRLFDGSTLQAGLAVVVRDGRIVDVVDRQSLAPAILVRDLGAGILSHGFVDIQVNGGGGVLFNADPTAGAVRRIAVAHRQYGTTHLLPTVITDAAAVQTGAVAAVTAMRHADKDGAVPGIHLEGPFFDPVRRGAHPAEHIRPPVDADIVGLCALARSGAAGTVLVTLAPNAVSLAMVRQLADAGVNVSLGHSNATAEQANAALAAGARCFTHLFNAMSPLGHRSPGMVGAALAARNAHISIIADGHHVDPTALTVALAAAGDRLFLISDAMPCAAGGPDAFMLQGRPVERRGTRLTLADGTLAGAAITLADAVAYITTVLSVPAAQALAMATTIPARAVGLDAGRIRPGTPSSQIIHLDADLTLRDAFPLGPV